MSDLKEWKYIPGYEGIYQINTSGDVRSVDRYVLKKTKSCTLCKHFISGKTIKSHRNNKGYLLVQLCSSGKCKHYLVHRLVATTFLSNPNNLPEVNHKDENKENCSVNNLEWCTRVYNNSYGCQPKHNRIIAGYKRGRRIKQFALNGELLNIFMSIRQAERITGVNNRNIIRCCKHQYKQASGYMWEYDDGGGVMSNG